MEKRIEISEGENDQIGNLLVNRLLPGKTITNIGPFVLLDHVYPLKYKKGIFANNRLEPHPHRGMISFTYVLDGKIEHFDSLGNQQLASSDEAHWINSGSGIIHAIRQGGQLKQKSKPLHAIEFWLNIPIEAKQLKPVYKYVKAEMFPTSSLPDNAGEIRVLIGKLGSLISPLPNFSLALLYHFKLNPKSTFNLATSSYLEYGVFAPDGPVEVNGSKIGKSQIAVFAQKNEKITFVNQDINQVDVFILGGEKIAEPFVLTGPFVMNSDAGIAMAYRDFFAGKYGKFLFG